MAWLDSIFGNPNSVLSAVQQNIDLQKQIYEVQDYVDEVREDLLRVADQFDNLGWSPLGNQDPASYNQIPLSTVKKIAETGRALVTNPFVDRAVNARIGYIWGGDLKFTNTDSSSDAKIKVNKRTLFSAAAHNELETALATDGNVFLAVHRGDDPAFRIPMHEITGSISNPDNNEEIWYIRREWSVKKSVAGEAEQQETKKEKYYPTLEYSKRVEEQNLILPRRFGKIGVEQNYVIHHLAVNKQIGWRWGLPDVTSAIFFARVYKEFLEDNVDLVKAFSRIAMQVKTGTQGAANSAYAALTQPRGRDPITGESVNNPFAITGPETDIVATGLNAGQVNMDNGDPLAQGIAAAMNVPVDVVLGRPQQGALDIPTKRIMRNRQEVWADWFEDLFSFWGDDDAELTWVQIDEDETHRRAQSLVLGLEAGVLHREEVRAEYLDTFNIAAYSDELPDDPAEVAFERAQAQTAASAVPGQGNSGAVGSVNSGRGQNREAMTKSMDNQTK